MEVRNLSHVAVLRPPLLAMCSLVVTSLILSGCASVPPGLPGVGGAYTGPGKRLRALGDDAELSPPRLLAYADDSALIVTTFGSSSCPDVPEVSAVDESEGTVLISLTVLGADGACTADVSERTFRLEGVGGLGAYTVAVADL